MRILIGLKQLRKDCIIIAYLEMSWAVDSSLSESHNCPGIAKTALNQTLISV